MRSLALYLAAGFLCLAQVRSFGLAPGFSAQRALRLRSAMAADSNDAPQLQELLVKSHETKLAAIEAAKRDAAAQVAEKLAALEERLREVEARNQKAVSERKADFEEALKQESPKAAAKAGKPTFPEGKPKPDYSKVPFKGEPTMKVAPGEVHPAYASRTETESFKSRWGAEEVKLATEVSAKGASKAKAAPAKAAAKAGKPTFPEDKPKPDYSKVPFKGEPTMKVAPGEVHPAYASRTETESFKSRWGAEEVKLATEVSAKGASKAKAAPAKAAAKAGKPTFPEGKPKPDYSKVPFKGEPTMKVAPGEVHPAYASRTETESFKSRWGAEEVKLATEVSAKGASKAKAAPAKAAAKAAGAGAPASASSPAEENEFMSRYLVETHEAKLALQAEIESLRKRATAAEEKADAGTDFMKEYLVNSQQERSELLTRATSAEAKVAEMQVMLDDYQEQMAELLVKSHAAKIEAIERAKVDAIAEYAKQLEDIQKNLLED